MRGQAAIVRGAFGEVYPRAAPWDGGGRLAGREHGFWTVHEQLLRAALAN